MREINKTNWWHFIITDEQAEKIKAKDSSAICKFYSDNADLLKKLVGKALDRAILYGSKPYKGGYYFADYFNQVICDLPLYNYTSGYALVCCIFKSVRYMKYGGYIHSPSQVETYALFSDIKDINDDRTTEDFLVGDRDIYDTINKYYGFERYFQNFAEAVFPTSIKLQQMFLDKV